MHHYFEAITNTSGDSLVGYFARVIDPATQNTVTMSADDNGTPIVTKSGVDNMGSTDDYGNLDFYVVPGTYHLDIYAPNATSFIFRVPNIAMNSSKGDSGPVGEQGPAGEGLAEVMAPTGAGLVGLGARSVKSKLDEWISPYDTLYAGGAKGDGITDDSAAITQASAMASIMGRSVNLTNGKFAVANARLPTAGAGDSSYIGVVGEPYFVQLTPNTPCIATSIADPTRLQSVGHKIRCTVQPHPSSSKSNTANIAFDATGCSAADIHVTLAQATSYTATTGRFNTVVFARSNSPFHYGNRIHVVLNAVPAPKYGVRFGNGGAGAAGNPNINTVSGYFNALDTVAGDIMLDLGDSTQVKVVWPTLMEACPNATAVRAGNFCVIEGVWFENMGIDIDFLGTASTTPNNCKVTECQFSGGGHSILVRNDLGAPPLFEHNIGDDTNVTYRDQNNVVMAKPISTRSHAQPANPTITFTVGGGSFGLNTSGITSRADHHGVTTCQLQYFVTPAAVGSSQLRIVPPSGYVIDQANVGVRDGTTNIKFAAALGDNLAGTDFDFAWATTNLHAVNVRVTMRAAI